MNIDELRTLAAKLTDEVDAMQRMLDDLKGDHSRDRIALSLCQKAHEVRIQAERERIADWMERSIWASLRGSEFPMIASVADIIRRGEYPR